MNTKKVKELSGLTQEQIARALDLTLNGWQRKERYNTEIRVKLLLKEESMAELLQFSNTSKKSVSELVSEFIELNRSQLIDNSFWTQ